ncbi:hypothetical protein ACYZTM_22650 [Pseudomonas sp. MDT2-39-1]|uniref:hypothetical protein n=1 Tax=Pseudomonas sp. BGI-2 TaxID=2528211 RepID=UPI001034AB38|nr:hypothetical protein [Pseudomonas sp. BGI-2]TBN46863.1 hypothetical protein EYC95_11095 [Pseudomonas sp. BGI-2]
MNRWRRLWLIIKLIAALAACVAVAIQAFLYMLESSDAVQIHPLSILVVGLIFGFITFGLLSLIERGVLGLVVPNNSRAQAEPEGDAEATPEWPLTLPTEDPIHQRNL